MTLRILITGSREWRDQGVIEEAILDQVHKYGYHRDPEEVVIVHGKCASGADEMAGRVAKSYGLTPEEHPASEHTSPLHRNTHMARLGADVCLAFAETWASGTGHCARQARAYGIPVIDYGVKTAREDRPW